MQLYHHPYSLDSQKVRLALEEKGIDYTSNHVNPITGKNMDASFFGINQSAKLPVFQNGSHIIFDTIEIIQYVSSFAFLFYHCSIECMSCVWKLFQI
jgi:glutathione S-transferase